MAFQVFIPEELCATTRSYLLATNTKHQNKLLYLEYLLCHDS